MGNGYSSDLHSTSSEQSMLLLLVRYWSSVVETDNLSLGSRKLTKLRRKGSMKNLTSRRIGKLSRNGSFSSKFKKGQKNKTKASLDLKSIPENEVFDWKTKTYEEIEKMKENVQWKEFLRVEDSHFKDMPKVKKKFRRKKKHLLNEEDESKISNEMWTLSEKSPSEYGSITDSRNLYEEVRLSTKYMHTSDINLINQTYPEKIFWKTSKLSLPEIQTSKNNHMLWRSSKDIQKFCGDNCINLRDISAIFQEEPPPDYEGSSAAGTVKHIGHLETFGRKTRLSRWTFLRSDVISMDHTLARRRDAWKKEQSARGGVTRKSSFRIPQRRYSRKVREQVFQREYKGGRRWGLFKNLRGAVRTSSLEAADDESCRCSCCSCEGCLNAPDEAPAFDTISLSSSFSGEMPPNSEEERRLSVQKTWSNEISDKEPQRPPVYNPEDYALSLKKWGRKANSGMQLPLYISQSTGSIERISTELTKSLGKRQSSPSTKSSNSSKMGDEKKKDRDLDKQLEKKELKNKENLGSKDGLNKDYRNPTLTLAPEGGEMTLRQFSSVTELLGKLKIDLKLSFPSFVQEFVGDPVDGVTLLLELLRAVQLSQASQQQRCPPQLLRRALLDEHSCLICLKHCLRCPDASRRLASSPAGLFTLAVCIMSNVTKSRIIALELLTRACEPPACGHAPVSEALSTLRLRFGEPVRFRFLVGMLNSAGAVELLTAGMRFINAFIETAASVQQRVYIQAELEQAGFNAATLRKTLPNNSDGVKFEVSRWEKNYFDVESLERKMTEMAALRDKVQLLEKKIQILQEEKGVLLSLEQCLKERCSELEEEVSIKTSTTSLTKSTAHIKHYNYQHQDRNEKDESTPAEDEGISSSEQELSQDEEYGLKGSQHIPIIPREKIPLREVKSEPKKPPRANLSPMVKPARNLKNNKMKETNVDNGYEVGGEEEEETTIEEVIEELRNIVNDAETEAMVKDRKVPEKREAPEKPPKTYLRKRMENKVAEEKTRTYTKTAFEKECDEAEIVPAILLPQPPRRTRSLVHIFLPGREYDGDEKTEFFDEDTDTESSDSLLTTGKEKSLQHCHHKSLDVTDSFNSTSTANTRTLFIQQQQEIEERGYQERNIDEEEIKRRHLKDKLPVLPRPEIARSKPKLPDNKNAKKIAEENKKNLSSYQRSTQVHDRLGGGFRERLIDGPINSSHEKTTSFQGIKSCIADGKPVNQSPFVRRTQRFIPIPVKRSQTFHIATPDNSSAFKRADLKPKPKMGVSGLDLQRSSEHKIKNDYGKYQNVEYKKNQDTKKIDNERYVKRLSKEKQKAADKGEKSKAPVRRGSFDGLFFITEFKKKDGAKKIKNDEKSKSNCNLSEVYGVSSQLSESSDHSAKLRSKSLERMDDGLDSLIDIVISPEKSTKIDWNIENKNIGPRTRRSLAESSLFTHGQLNNLNKEQKTTAVPQPAQRTSLARQNSASSTPLHLPVEITVPPKLNLYSYGMKPAKSEDSLSTRYPPDGSSSPSELPLSQLTDTCTLYEPTSRKISSSSKNSSKSGDSPIYATPFKQSKLQKFFGNPKFENSVGSDAQHSKYFESNYACAPVAPERTSKPVSPMPRNMDKITNSTTQMVKNLMTTQAPKTAEVKGERKLNFFLSTYQPQSPPAPTSSPTPFTGAFMLKRGAAGMYTGAREQAETNQGYRSPAPTESSIKSTPGANKVTDSLSGLY